MLEPLGDPYSHRLDGVQGQIRQLDCLRSWQRLALGVPQYHYYRPRRVALVLLNHGPDLSVVEFDDARRASSCTVNVAVYPSPSCLEVRFL